MFFDWEVFFKKFPKTVIIWAVSGQIWSERRNFKKFSILEAIGHLLDRYEVERRKMIFFIVQLNKRHFAVPIWCERRKIDFFHFQLSKQLLAGQIWCGRRKIKKFLDLVIKLPIADPICSRKRNFFSKMEAKRRFLSLYVVKEKKTKHFCNKSFSGLIWSERGKSEIFSSINLAKRTLLSLYDVKGRKQSDFCQNAPFYLY